MVTAMAGERLPGILAIWNDCRAGREAEFDAWFQGEHLLERLAVPGFLFGRRHQAISGSAGHFNFYLVESPEVLTSKVSGTARQSDADDKADHVRGVHQHEPYCVPSDSPARWVPGSLRRHCAFQHATGR